MIIFIVNMVSVSMVVMAAVVLIILRERTDTQILLAGICLEGIVALGSLLWVQPGDLDMHFLAVRAIGRTIEAMAMWYVITAQVRGIQRSLLEPTTAERFGKKLEELEAKVVEATKPQEDGDATTH